MKTFGVIPNRLDIPFSDDLISEIRFRMPAGILRVFVLEAKDLGRFFQIFCKPFLNGILDLSAHLKCSKANDDFFGESDPYVALTVGAQTKQTEIVFNNCKNPIWERFFFKRNYVTLTRAGIF